MSPGRERKSRLLGAGEIDVSFEFFPPKTDKMEAALWTAIERLAPLAEVSDVLVIARRAAHEVEQVEDAPRGNCQVGGDGAGDAAGCAGDDEDRVFVQRHARLAVARWLLHQRDGVPEATVVAHLDHAGVVERFSQQRVGRLGRLAADLEVHGLDHNALAAVAHGLFHVVGFGEADHRAAKRSRGAGRAVAVQTAQPRRRHQEGVRPAHAVIERPRRGVEILDAHPVD